MKDWPQINCTSAKRSFKKKLSNCLDNPWYSRSLRRSRSISWQSMMCSSSRRLSKKNKRGEKKRRSKKLSEAWLQTLRSITSLWQKRALRFGRLRSERKCGRRSKSLKIKILHLSRSSERTWQWGRQGSNISRHVLEVVLLKEWW